MNLSGSIFDYFIVFWAGVLTSFTPCIYPLLPLTAGFIAGANIKGNRLTAFVLSLVYVFGLAISYSILGAVAVLTGRFFGHFHSNPYMFIGIGIFLILFGLIMVDAISFPVFGVRFQNKIRPKGFWAILLFGMLSGLVVGPCTAPILGTLLLYVGSKQNIFHAVSLLFVFSYGVGFSLILVGTFSGLLARLPKSGKWLIYIKRISAIILFSAAVYFIIKGLFLLTNFAL